MNTKKFLFGGACLLVINEYLKLQERLKLRDTEFEKARNHADSLGKPLLVIGRPDGWTEDREVKKGDSSWWNTGAHPCGDITIDVRPIKGNECPNYISTDAADLSMIPTGSIGAIFSSCTLEHIPNLPQAYREMLRVLDFHGEIYSVLPQRYSIFAWIFPHHHWVIDKITREEFKAIPLRKGHQYDSKNKELSQVNFARV